jgi:hypothetical protein
MKKHRNLLAAAGLALAGGLTLSDAALAYTALAINGNHGSQYGWATGLRSPNLAAAAALGYCGNGCRVVLQYSSGCGAYAADQAGGSSIYGWGTAGSRRQAEAIALGECRGRGGSACIVRVWACE